MFFSTKRFLRTLVRWSVVLLLFPVAAHAAFSDVEGSVIPSWMCFQVTPGLLAFVAIIVIFTRTNIRVEHAKHVARDGRP